jgi:hypothetical protein
MLFVFENIAVRLGYIKFRNSTEIFFARAAIREPIAVAEPFHGAHCLGEPHGRKRKRFGLKRAMDGEGEMD